MGAVSPAGNLIAQCDGSIAGEDSLDRGAINSEYARAEAAPHFYRGAVTEAVRENALHEGPAPCRQMEAARVTSCPENDSEAADLGSRIRHNLAEGCAVRLAGSEARTRSSYFVTSSAMLTYEVLRASVEDGEPSSAKAAAILSEFGLSLPKSRALATSLAKVVMGKGIGGDRLHRAAYAAQELLYHGGANPEAYLQENGGASGLWARWKRRLQPQADTAERVEPAREGGPAHHILVRVGRGVSTDDQRIIDELSYPDAGDQSGTARILPLGPDLMALIIGKAVTPLRQAADPRELVDGLGVVESRRAPTPRAFPLESSGDFQQDGLPF
ncbi:hypothetical protein [Roseomonas harenae]|uniref:hypothetical protein n=1 Tax=Muricoccus harenae TaxID=2692566 RepID=UPI001331AD11|nr:hypothetical protein [Roseomonas harenae]